MLTLNDYEKVRDGKWKQPSWHKPFQCNLPEGESGPWRIEKFTVEMDLTNLRLMRDGRGCYPGTYTRLVHKQRGIVMSDTTAEAADHLSAFYNASGRCLLHGLGLGCLLNACLTKPEVEHVDVVEIDEDVIRLVAPHFNDPRVAIHHGDCRTLRWPKGSRWDMVWHDIWDEICEDNIDEMIHLHRRFGRRSVWQGSWSRDRLERLR